MKRGKLPWRGVLKARLVTKVINEYVVKDMEFKRDRNVKLRARGEGKGPWPMRDCGGVELEKRKAPMPLHVISNCSQRSPSSC